MESWLRPHYRPGGGDARIFYVVFGRFPSSLRPLSRKRYRCEGVPAGLTLDFQEPGRFRGSGPIWELLQEENPRCAAAVASAPGCMALRGLIPDPPLLDYFRDTVGLLTYLLDQGGVALYDPFSLRWWEPGEWREVAFRCGQPRPHRHVVILTSEEPEGTVWLHTRGMLKFGRPDLSLKGLSPDTLTLYVEMVNRFIHFQALGGQIEEGQQVKLVGLPFGLRCYHQGGMEDPNFNNFHVEIRGD